MNIFDGMQIESLVKVLLVSSHLQYIIYMYTAFVQHFESSLILLSLFLHYIYPSKVR